MYVRHLDPDFEGNFFAVIPGTANAFVEVRAPMHMPKREIDAFVRSKEQWVTDKLAFAEELAESHEKNMPDYGGSLWFHGKQYKIEKRNSLGRGRAAGFDGEVFYMPPGLGKDQIKKVSIRLYRLLAETYIKERVAYFAGLMNVSPAEVKITGAHKRWGSCTSDKRLHFTWRLITAADELIDSVVVHELAHLIEMNHSERFWKIVRDVLPDIKTLNARMKVWYCELEIIGMY
jgi:predicted metal-dependent hydrolase